MDAERLRLEDARNQGVSRKKWGPCVSERQWGTAREDYSETGGARDYFTHDQVRSRASRWGEDGLAGASADTQQLCFALALWNGADPILKERLFGLTNREGITARTSRNATSTARRPITFSSSTQAGPRKYATA